MFTLIHSPWYHVEVQDVYSWWESTDKQAGKASSFIDELGKIQWKWNFIHEEVQLCIKKKKSVERLQHPFDEICWTASQYSWWWAVYTFIRLHPTVPLSILFPKKSREWDNLRLKVPQQCSLLNPKQITDRLSNCELGSCHWLCHKLEESCNTGPVLFLSGRSFFKIWHGWNGWHFKNLDHLMH